LLERPEPAVLCTHRPVLPWVYDTLGVEDPKLEPGALLVVHHRSGEVVAVERHAP
jgi:8-oxo-dGTP diphosphatase